MNAFIERARTWVNNNFVFFCLLAVIGIVVIGLGAHWL